MFLILGVTLYTSRIVLNVLGVEDYGIYSIVGGVVTLFGFLNAAMSSATQRYFSFDIGRNDFVKLKKTFSSTLVIHFFIGLFLLLLAETIGLWYVNHKMQFDRDRIYAVNVVYQFAIITSLLKILQVPYNALLFAKERLNVYAYISVVEVVLQLLVVLLLLLLNGDKLILFSIFTFFVALLVNFLYQAYCRNRFVESRFSLQFDKKYYKELLSYSGWNLFGNIAIVARGQGVNMVLNFYFGTALNAAYGLTLQVQSAINLFVTNFQMAANPQIIKTYSQNNLKQSHKLIIQTAKFSYFLMLLLICPILSNTGFLLSLWLKSPPPYTVLFVQLCLINALIDCISGPLMTGAQATGKIKLYQMVVGSLVFLNLPLSYFWFKFNPYHPQKIFIISIAISVISFFFRVYFLNKVMYLDALLLTKKLLIKIVLVSFFPFLITWLVIHFTVFQNEFVCFMFNIVLITLSNLLSIWILGLESGEKIFVKQNLVKNILKK